jgi:hypothetical protein
MKHHIIIKIIVFCALILGMGQLVGPQETALANSNQVHVGVGVRVAAYHRHHRRHRRHHRVVIAPRIDIHGH